MERKRNLLDMLRFDPLDTAEKVTGKSYKVDKATESLGMGLHFLHIREKRQALQEAEDVHYDSSVSWYQTVATKLGFLVAHEDSFKCKSSGQEETKYVCYREKGGVLLVWDTYNGHVNDASFYYNWEPNRETQPYEYTSSGQWVNIEGEDKPRIWAGNHHGVEALKFNLLRLEQAGKFITPMLADPMLPWLTNREERNFSKEQDWSKQFKHFDILTTEKLKGMPQVIRDIYKVKGIIG